MATGQPGGRIIELDADRSDEALVGLWMAATDARRLASGLTRLPDRDASALQRAGAFGVGVFDGQDLVSAAVAMPALADDGRGVRPLPGLMHVSSVATLPGRWGEGLGRRVLDAIMAQGKRRGFARTQLWTHASNPVSRHLYEALGFTQSGRTKVDEFGEDIVHYLRELPAEPVTPRPAARLLCCDAKDRVLLLQWRDPFDGHELWEPPGGGIEAGETPRQAALREWAEETGLAPPTIIGGPVTVARDLIWLGDRHVSDEYFFLGRLENPGEPDVSRHTEVEQAAYLRHRWLSWQRIVDLGGSDEPDAVAALRRLDPAGPWA